MVADSNRPLPRLQLPEAWHRGQQVNADPRAWGLCRTKAEQGWWTGGTSKPRTGRGGGRCRQQHHPRCGSRSPLVTVGQRPHPRLGARDRRVSIRPRTPRGVPHGCWDARPAPRARRSPLHPTDALDTAEHADRHDAAVRVLANTAATATASALISASAAFLADHPRARVDTEEHAGHHIVTSPSTAATPGIAPTGALAAPHSSRAHDHPTLAGTADALSLRAELC
jgi:hypothetical protein